MFVISPYFDKDIAEKEISKSDLRINTEKIINSINQRYFDIFRWNDITESKMGRPFYIYFSDLYYFLRDITIRECYNILFQKVFPLFKEQGWKIEVYCEGTIVENGVYPNSSECIFKFIVDKNPVKNDKEINKFGMLDV